MANGSDQTYTVIGLMSGTSLDGIDVSLLQTDGERIEAFGESRTYPYEVSDKAILRRALEIGPTLGDRYDRPDPVAKAETLTTDRHIEAVQAFLSEQKLRPDAVDLIGFHGQTIFHDASRHLTIQLGNGQAMADRLGIRTVHDFRNDDVNSGGEGAPFAPAFHRAAAAFADMDLPIVFLNIGGVANVTWIGSAGELISFDTGPGNALIDDWVRTRSDFSFDEDGRIARLGNAPNEVMMTRWLEQSYFSRVPPKSLDRNDFQTWEIDGLSAEDGANFLTHFTARSIALAARHFPAKPKRWIMTGGGRLNVYTVELLRNSIDAEIVQAEDFGLDGDAVEAQAFAFLAARSALGLPLSYPGTTGVKAPLSGGRIAVPSDEYS